MASARHKERARPRSAQPRPIPGADRAAPAGLDESRTEARDKRASGSAARRPGGLARILSGGRAHAATGGGGKGRDGKGRRGRRSRLGRIAYWSVVLVLWALIAAVGLLAWVGAHLPPIQSLQVPKRPPTIHILGLDGRLLATRGEMGGSAVPVEQLPRHVAQAFLAIEDRRFFGHFGIDPLGVMRAVSANLWRRGVAQGGSTITQQLAKNVFLTQERTLTRKLQEAVLALWLEHKFSKDEILELYLNRIYFGSGAYGIEAAAQRYFAKSARRITLSEAALLAGVVKSPARLSPTRNYDGAERRAHVVLTAMADAGFISDKQAAAALANPPRIARGSTASSANYAADWVMDLLNDLVGRVEQDIVVETTIDPALQEAAERSLVDELAQKGEKLGVGQGAVVAMTPDGAIRALVGGRDYGDSQFNRAISAKRQPGSAFKPFVYLTALERGLSPSTMREDRPIDVRGWRPENFTREYFGPVTLARGLAMSLNTVAVRLTLEVGPQSVVRTAHRLGIASKLQPNASIALGTSEVSVLEMVAAFAPFANGGIAVSPYIVDRVRSAQGKLLYRSRKAELGRVVEERHVGMMNAMMQDTLLTGTGRKAELPGWQAAGKTGTSQDFRDAWFVGYTGRLVAGVWLGNDDNSPTRKTTGGGLPSEIWSRFMRAAHHGAIPVPLPGGSGALSAAAAPGSPPGTLRDADSSRREARDTGVDSWLLDRLFRRP